MKSVKELKEGNCIVITEYGRFNGYFSEEYKSVFFTIPSNYKIIGYEQ